MEKVKSHGEPVTITIKPERSVDSARSTRDDIRDKVKPHGEPIAITIKADANIELTRVEKSQGVPVTITIKSDRAMTEAQHIESNVEKPPRTSSIDENRCYVKNSSFLSRDIEARKAQVEANTTKSKEISLPKKVISPPARTSASLSKKESITSQSAVLSPKTEALSAVNINKVVSPQESDAIPPIKKITSPPMSAFKTGTTEARNDKIISKTTKKDSSVTKEIVKLEKCISDEVKVITDNKNGTTNDCVAVDEGNIHGVETEMQDESNGVGDKIKKFEKVAEDANVGRLSRPGSVRGRSRTERLGSDSKDDLPPPATPFKDVHFELNVHTDKATNDLDHQPVKNNSPNIMAMKWQKSLENNPTEEKIKKPEPQKIIKPEFKPMTSSVDVTIRSPSLGAKIPDQFPSHGTAFRNVASPDVQRNIHKFNEDVNTQNNFKACKFKKEKYSVSKGSSYFTRGSEEIWLVKKKDIEEIEERVLDSFRRAGGNICMRSESMRPSSDSGQGVSFTHATMGRTKRQMYARSESLDPQWANARAQTLKRQSSVACTCGHDKKTRARNVTDVTSRPRSRSHGDENNQSQGHVLDKYETLV